MQSTVTTKHLSRDMNRSMNEGIRSAWRQAERRLSRKDKGTFNKYMKIARMLTKTRGLQIKYGNVYYPVADAEANAVMSYVTRHHGLDGVGGKILWRFLRYMSDMQRGKGRITVARAQWNVFKTNAAHYSEEIGNTT